MTLRVEPPVPHGISTPGPTDPGEINTPVVSGPLAWAVPAHARPHSP